MLDDIISKKDELNKAMILKEEKAAKEKQKID